MTTKQLVDRAVAALNDLVVAVVAAPPLPEGLRNAIVEADYLINSVQDSDYWTFPAPEPRTPFAGDQYVRGYALTKENWWALVPDGTAMKDRELNSIYRMDRLYGKAPARS